jgi:hypothetical protein
LIIPGKYVSTAVVKLPDGDAGFMSGHVLSRASLSGIIRKEDIYKSERRRRPLEEVIEAMKHDITVASLGKPGTQPRTLRVGFAYPDRSAAQRVNRDLLAMLGAEVIDPASLPERPERPNPALAILGGLAAGLVAGGLWTVVRRRPARWMLRVAGAGVAGMLLGGAVSYAVADRFVSNAVMRISKSAQAALPAALGEESLAAIVHTCDLYPGRRDAMERIRRDVRVTRVTATPQFDVYRIAFTYGDRYKAQRAVREMVQRTAQLAARAGNGGRPLEGASDNQEFLAWRSLPAGAVELINAASLPEAPAGPNRLLVAMLGLLAGLVAGAFRWRDGDGRILRQA